MKRKSRFIAFTAKIIQYFSRDWIQICKKKNIKCMCFYYNKNTRNLILVNAKEAEQFPLLCSGLGVMGVTCKLNKLSA